MKYPKVLGPYLRYIDGPDKNKLDMGNWSRPEFKLLKDLPWTWTEKVNGTNIRVLWDGYKVRFGGRTDGASIPAKLIEVLIAMFPEELMEQKFGASSATLFGEGFGPGVASGSGVYRKDPGFVLFDVRVPDVEGTQWWLERENVTDVADSLAIEVVPLVGFLDVEQAIRMVTAGHESKWGDFLAEGLVGTAPLGLKTRGGERIQMKIKTKDFRHG